MEEAREIPPTPDPALGGIVGKGDAVGRESPPSSYTAPPSPAPPPPGATDVAVTAGTALGQAVGDRQIVERQQAGIRHGEEP